MVAQDPVLTPLDDAELSLDPGAEAQVRLRVGNVGNTIEAYRVEVLGDAAPWTTVESRSPNFRPPAPDQPATLKVDKGDDDELTVVLRPPGDGTAPAGLVVVGVRVFSEENDTAAVAELHLRVGGVTRLHLAVQPVERSARWSTRYRVTVENRGNDRARIELVGADDKDELRVTPAERTTSVAGRGGVHETSVRVQNRSPRIAGKPASHRITVTARERLREGAAAGAEPTASATFVAKPVLGGLAPVLLLVVVVAVVAAVLLLRPDPAPATTPSPPAPPEVAVSTTPQSVELSWEPFAPGAYGDAFRVSFMGEGGPAGVAAVTEGVQQASVSVGQDVDGEPLRRGEEHCFIVQVLVDDQPGSPSPVVCATIPEVDVPPAEVTAEPGDGEIVLTWDEVDGAEEYILLHEGRRDPGVTPGVTVPGKPGEEVCAAIVVRVGTAESPASEACATVPLAGGGGGGEGGGGEGGGGGGGEGGNESPAECQLDGHVVIFFLDTTTAADTNQRLLQALSAARSALETDGDPATDPAQASFGTGDALGFPPGQHAFTIGYVDGLADADTAEALAAHLADTAPTVLAETIPVEGCGL